MQNNERKYYELAEAAKLLGCDVDYLLGLGAEGIIEVYMHVGDWELTRHVYGKPAPSVQTKPGWDKPLERWNWEMKTH